MKIILCLIIGILAIVLLMYNFIKNPINSHIIGFEVNVWIYRLFWGLIGYASIHDFIKNKKSNKDE